MIYQKLNVQEHAYGDKKEAAENFPERNDIGCGLMAVFRFGYN